MDLQIELYTTPTVEGRKILSSKGFVCANVVLDARGINEDYQMMQKFPKYMDKEGVEPYHVELFDALEREVLNKGGNAVIDLHIEHNYVKCGQSDYSLLISAQGTAVVLEGINIPENKYIKGEVLEQQFRNKQILAKLTKWNDEINYAPLYIDFKEWIYICQSADISFADILHKAYNSNRLSISSRMTGTFKYDDYFKKLPYDEQVKLSYTYCGDNCIYLIKKFDLFDAKHILEWVTKGEIEFATACLDACKKEYSAQDLEDMQCLYDFLATLPTVKGNYEEDYQEDNDYEKRNKKDRLTEWQEERVKAFGVKIETLKELLSCNN